MLELEGYVLEEWVSQAKSIIATNHSAISGGRADEKARNAPFGALQAIVELKEMLDTAHSTLNMKMEPQAPAYDDDELLGFVELVSSLNSPIDKGEAQRILRTIMKHAMLIHRNRVPF